MTTNIPKARDLIAEARTKLDWIGWLNNQDTSQVDELLRRALELMTRKINRRADISTKEHLRLTDEQKSSILRLAAEHDDLTQLEIANIVGTNPGRVSEVINGHR